MPRFALAALLALAAPLAVPSAAQRIRRPPPAPEALRAGLEIPWLHDLPAALQAGASAGRRILWYVPTVPGSTMDRRPEIDMYMMAGPFSSPDVVALIRRRYVALKAVPDAAAAARYDLRPLAFIEPGLLVLETGGDAAARVDRLSTLHADWFLAWLHRHGGDVAPGDPETVLECGDAEAALRAFDALPDADRESHRGLALRGRILHRRGDLAEAAACLRRAGSEPAVRIDLARVLMAAGDMAGAGSALAEACAAGGPRRDEAEYLLGAVEWSTRRDREALDRWKRLVRERPDARFTPKAAAEAGRHGPFSRGFEEYVALPQGAILPEPEGTRRPLAEDDAADAIRRSIAFLLRQQRASGAFDDSAYDFGGADSLPNVHMAVTAIAARALLRHAAPDRGAVEAALDLAFRFVLDDSHIARDDKDEIAWAHIYRLVFLADVARMDTARRDRALAAMNTIARALEDLQLPTGGWFHEYPNPFVTASAIVALKEAESAGAKVRRRVLDRGVAALRKARSPEGLYPYGFSTPPAAAEAIPTAGRNPLCELALFRASDLPAADLARAVDLSVRHHAHFESVRKYDNHAPPYGIGGFFFWYDMQARADAARALRDDGERAGRLRELRALVLSIAEIDRTWVDSHELGRVYGTASALNVLADTAALRE